jgi:hypothetical protein
MDDAQKQAALSALRTLLAVAGAWIVKQGWADDSTVNEVIGAVMILGPLAWGMADKFLSEKKTAEREHQALNAGIAISNADPSPDTPAVPKDEVSDALKAVKTGAIAPAPPPPAA